MTGIGMLIDTSKCMACKACQIACQQWHTLEAEDTFFSGSYQNPPDMSGANLTVVKFTEREVGEKIQWLFFKDMCRHCDHPSCKSACPLKAIKRGTDGRVRIVKSKCKPKECTRRPGKEPKPCQANCPFNIPKWKYTVNGTVKKKKMTKCDFCYNRATNAKLLLPPFVSSDGQIKSTVAACALTCPPGAIITGDIGDIEIAAADKVSYLKANGYPNANVYPADLPTHVKWVLLEPPEVYGIPPY
jgi:formate dehydrogenase iron-sulfur subunit